MYYRHNELLCSEKNSYYGGIGIGLDAEVTCKGVCPTRIGRYTRCHLCQLLWEPFLLT